MSFWKQANKPKYPMRLRLHDLNPIEGKVPIANSRGSSVHLLCIVSSNFKNQVKNMQPQIMRRCSLWMTAQDNVSKSQAQYMNSMKLVIPLYFISWKKTPNDAVTPQRQSQFTPKMKANAVPRLLSSLVWIDHYNECNGMTSFMEFMYWDKHR